MPARIEAEWFVFGARGHPNVRATHRTTLEVTREDYLTPRGDCIVAVEAEAGLADLPEGMKHAIRAGGLVVLVICAGGLCDSVVGRGAPGLALDDPVRMIVRRSTHQDSRTLMIRASKAARDLDRRLVSELRQGKEVLVAVGVVPPWLLPEGLREPAGIPLDSLVPPDPARD